MGHVKTWIGLIVIGLIVAGFAFYIKSTAPQASTLRNGQSRTASMNNAKATPSTNPTASVAPTPSSSPKGPIDEERRKKNCEDILKSIERGKSTLDYILRELDKVAETMREDLKEGRTVSYEDQAKMNRLRAEYAQQKAWNEGLEKEYDRWCKD